MQLPTPPLPLEPPGPTDVPGTALQFFACFLLVIATVEMIVFILPDKWRGRISALQFGPTLDHETKGAAMIEQAHAPSAAMSALLPHPLGKFALDGRITNVIAAQTLVDLIADATLLDPESRRAIGARWFLLESRQAYFLACDVAGIDARKLRDHLRERFEVKHATPCSALAT